MEKFNLPKKDIGEGNSVRVESNQQTYDKVIIKPHRFKESMIKNRWDSYKRVDNILNEQTLNTPLNIRLPQSELINDGQTQYIQAERIDGLPLDPIERARLFANENLAKVVGNIIPLQLRKDIAISIVKFTIPFKNWRLKI